MKLEFKDSQNNFNTFDLFSYSNAIGKSESNNNYTVKNSIGALGKYQFIESTLNALQNLYGLPDWKNETYFLNYPDLQEQYFLYFVYDNLKQFNNSTLNRYLGTTIFSKHNGSAVINIYGIMGGMHLGGFSNTYKLLTQGIDKSDGKTYISDYVVKFSKINTTGEKNIPNNSALAVLTLLLTTIKG